MIEAAQRYLEAGLCALPAHRAQKRVALATWKEFQTRLPAPRELTTWFSRNPDAMCIVCGGVSGNLEVLDFDAGGECFTPWSRRIPRELLERLVISRSPSGGYHVVYRCEEPVTGSAKIAERPGDETSVTLIETRGEGGLFLCSPTPGYELIQGSLDQPPVLTSDERYRLLCTAWEFNEVVRNVVGGSGSSGAASTARGAGNTSSSTAGALRPGDDYNQRGDVRELLQRHGWARVTAGENEHWRRPGKTACWSATLKAFPHGLIFYVFSSSAAPFEPNHAYTPFAVYSLLEHGGDFSAAAGALRVQGYGSDEPCAAYPTIDVSALPSKSKGKEKQPKKVVAEVEDPGPLPAELLRIPGFISEVMDFCLDTAPYPNPVMSFGAALALQAFLGGRKVRDSGDNRTNIYLLGLAYSAAGKDWPRKINARILNEVGLAHALGEGFASGEGLQDALYQTPSMLFQTDEIDALVQSINRSNDARYEPLLATLLTLFSASNSVFPMRRKAGQEAGGSILQPSLVVYGTAIPNHYYNALSERMLTNGFFARTIILEAGQRGRGQEPSLRDLPQRVVETADWWTQFKPGDERANLAGFFPVPKTVAQSQAAQRLLVQAREEADHEYDQAEANKDIVGTAVWGRTTEQIRKLSLIYAISENHKQPEISKAAVDWANRFVMHRTRRMLFMAAGHVAANPFHADCLRLLQKLRDAPDKKLPHSVLLKRMKMKAKDFNELKETLVQRGDLQVTTTPRSGTPLVEYRLVEEG